MEAVTMRVREVVVVAAADFDAMVDVADHVRARRAVYVALFRMRLLIDDLLELRVERDLTGFVDDVDHRVGEPRGRAIAGIFVDLREGRRAQGRRGRTRIVITKTEKRRATQK